MISSSIEPKEINFERLFNPRAIGIIGASYNPTGGGDFVQAMKDRYRGPMYLFNPRLKGQELFGYKVYESILEIPEEKPIDYVILSVPAELCPKVLENRTKIGAFCDHFRLGI